MASVVIGTGAGATAALEARAHLDSDSHQRAPLSFTMRFSFACMHNTGRVAHTGTIARPCMRAPCQLSARRGFNCLHAGASTVCTPGTCSRSHVSTTLGGVLCIYTAGRKYDHPGSPGHRASEVRGRASVHSSGQREAPRAQPQPPCRAWSWAWSKEAKSKKHQVSSQERYRTEWSMV